MIKGNRPGHRRRHRQRLFGIGHAVRGPQQFHQTFGCASRTLQFTPDFRQGPHGPRHHHRIDHELHQCARRHGPGAHIMRPDPQHAHNARKHQKDHDHRHYRAGGDPAAGGIIAFFRHIREIPDRGGFIGKRLHRLDGLQRFGGMAGRCRDPVLIFTAQHAQFAAHRQDRHNHQWHDQQHQPRQLGRGQQH